ncbi:hypothetical protein G7Y89_g3323 [Cudoniella acicularis]|uniref:Uncharacterized protein n=1 Tax=Cudoniella acicularis TaxID=354080 RepID=A0A8H4W8I6_9HELO|nr:hypothetical protein G7Y89_g3323 [Cudoniella acicularis]
MVDFSGWWFCSNCGREVIPDLNGDNCPDCSHMKCSECFEFDAVSHPPVPSVDFQAPRYFRAGNKSLEIFLNSKFTNACADTGSQVNCISEAYANALGIIITNVSNIFKLPIGGRKLMSIGTTTISCRFPTRPEMRTVQNFFVFSRLACNVIFGLGFLRNTRTLDLHTHRLRDVESSKNKQTINSIGTVSDRISCRLNGTQFWALPDTGATINLISSRCAQELGYLKQQRNQGIVGIEDIPPCAIQFVDGSASISTLVVDLRISFQIDLTVLSSVAPIQLDDPNKKSTSPRQPSSLPMLATLLEPFYVLDDLDLEVVLSGSLLHSVNAYVNYARNFRTVETSDTPSIAWGAKKKAGEGSTRLRAPVPDDARFCDEMTLVMDELEWKINRIEEEYNLLEIDETTKAARLEQAQQCYCSWLKDHRENVERLFGRDWYLQKVPQELGEA